VRAFAVGIGEVGAGGGCGHCGLWLRLRVGGTEEGCWCWWGGGHVAVLLVGGSWVGESE
jgi:hypothetical protein